MPVLDRRVRHLHLAAARDDDARHGRVLIEDALRTASLGDESRLIIVRRCDLGRLPVGASATAWSRRLESSMHRLAATPVSAHHPDAAFAPVVYFQSRDEPWLILAHRTLAGLPCTAWFWRTATPTWTAAHSTVDTLRLCVRTLAEQGGLAGTLPLLTRLPPGVSDDSLLRSITADDLASLRRELDPGPPEPSAPSAERPSFRPSGSDLPPPRADDLRWIATWGWSDVRTRWLVAARLTGSRSNRGNVLLADVPARSRLQATLQAWVQAIPSTRSPVASASSTATPAPPARKRTTPACASERSPPPPGAVDDAPSAEPAPAAPDVTHAGGLCFLLPLLQRAGFPEFAASRPAEERGVIAWQLLRLALRHARIPDNDPWVTALDDLPRAAPGLGHWLLDAHRRCLRATHVSLRELIRRPALLSLSRTHVDVFFRAGEADVRLRRAGLDLDPGWVPWLGRVVSFHYTRED